MRKYIAFFICLTLICVPFVSCKKNTSDNGLSKFDGWWCRPDGYDDSKDDSALSDIFMINAAEGTLTCYSKYGIASEKYICHANDNTINVDISAIGYVTLIMSEDGLTDASGEKLEYIKGTPVEPTDLSVFIGKWYKNGDLNESYYIISNEAYEFKSGNMQNEKLHAGTWTRAEAVRYTASGIGYDEILLVLSNSYTSDTYRAEYEYSLLCGGLVLYDNVRAEFYIRESDIKTDAGISAKERMVLISEEWVGEDGKGNSPYIRFTHYSSEIELVKYVQNENGSMYESAESLGKWNLNGKTLNIEYNDKTKESITLSGDSITLAKLNMTFKKDTY